MTTVYPAGSIRRDAVPIAAALLTTLFLFYIDEGYNDFRWMKEPGNWFAFIIYGGSFILGEYLVHRFVADELAPVPRTIVTVVLGLPLGLIIALAAIFCIGGLFRLVG
jgi:hypothetical protein